MINLLQTLSNISYSVFALLITIGVSLAIFLILRALMLWYWKVNKIVENQERQIEQQQIIIEKLREITEIYQNNKRILYLLKTINFRY